MKKITECDFVKDTTKTKMQVGFHIISKWTSSETQRNRLVKLPQNYMKLA